MGVSISTVSEYGDEAFYEEDMSDVTDLANYDKGFDCA